MGAVVSRRVALYARVSTADQTCENQLLEVRRYCEARSLEVVREFVDHGVSGAVLDQQPDIDDGDLAHELKDAAAKLRTSYTGREIQKIVDAVRGERQRRRP
jgi:predicted site-specific integrase-resolvase